MILQFTLKNRVSSQFETIKWVKFDFKHFSENFEYLTQDVINNPTVALRKLIDNAESSLSSVAQTHTSSTVTQTRTSSSARTRVLPSVQTRALPTAEPSVSSAAHSRVLPSTQTRIVPSVNARISSSSQQQRTLRTETRVSAQPRSTSALLDPILSDKDHYNLLKARLRSDLASFKETIVAKDIILRSSWQFGDQNSNSVFQYANPKLEDSSCSYVCYKEFKKVAKLLEKCPSTDSNCKMCINRSSIAVPANAVLYSCGHNFLCHGCAVSYWNKGKSCGCEGCLVNSKVVCPICRVAIKDVIKSYSPF